METSTTYYSTTTEPILDDFYKYATTPEPILDDFYKPSKTTADPPYQAQYCWERLPCGVCRRTNQPCPYGGYNKYEITC